MWSETLFEQCASTFALSTSWSKVVGATVTYCDIVFRLTLFWKIQRPRLIQPFPEIPRLWLSSEVNILQLRPTGFRLGWRSAMSGFNVSAPYPRPWKSTGATPSKAWWNWRSPMEPGGMVLKQVGISVPNFRALKGIQKDAKRTSGTRGGQQWVARFVCQLPKADHSCAIGTVEVNTCWYKSAGVPMDLHIFVAKLLVYCWLKFNSVRFSIHRCHRFPTAAWSSPQNRLKGKSEGNSTVHYYIYLEVKSMVSCKKQQNQPMAHGLSVSCQHLCFMAGHLQEGQWSCGILHLSLGQLWVSPDGAMAALFEGAPGNCQTQGECFLFFQE